MKTNKKTYIAPSMQCLSFETDGIMLTMSNTEVDGSYFQSNKKEYKSFWETEDVEEETSGIW